MSLEQASVLIIDDCLEDREAYRRYLLQDDRYTYRIWEEEYGEQGLSACDRLNPDVILLDFLLPDIDGLEFLSALKQQGKKGKLPVIMLTGQGNEAIAVRAMKSGAQDYLVKGDTTPESLRLAVHHIIEMAQLLRQLEQSEEQFRLVTDALPVLIAYVDAQQHYRLTNLAHEDWFGRRRSDINGCSIQEVLSGEAYQQICSYIETVLAGQSVTYETEMPHQDGSKRWVSTTYVPHFDGAGGVKGFFALSSDISDRKAIERMKDELIAVVSHELRTPLTSIHGSLKLLAAGQLGQLSPEGQQMLRIADENTDRLVRLVNDILDLQRLESDRVKPDKRRCNAAELVVRAVESLQGMARQHNITLVSNAASIPVRADADNIVQALANLLSNAIKFSPAGSTVEITVSPCQAVDEVGSDRAQQFCQRRLGVLFQVKDRGRGIPADKLEKIFERFGQVDASDSRQKGGTGLGLAICQTIVRQHGGEIWVESTLGEGSTFCFTLPEFDLDFGEGGDIA